MVIVNECTKERLLSISTRSNDIVDVANTQRQGYVLSRHPFTVEHLQLSPVQDTKDALGYGEWELSWHEGLLALVYLFTTQ